GWLLRAPAAALAFRRPAPAAACPNDPMGAAVLVWLLRMAAKPADGLSCSSRAATAPACGAAAEVPQNLQSVPSKEAKKVVTPQSVAAMSGLSSVWGVMAGAGELPLTGPK